MTYKEIRKLWIKCHKRCIYCGGDLNVGNFILTYKNPNGQRTPMVHQKLDIEDDNLGIACKVCARLKHGKSIEQFRQKIEKEQKRIKNDPYFKVYRHYGMINYSNWDKKFFFEK